MGSGLVQSRHWKSYIQPNLTYKSQVLPETRGRVGHGFFCHLYSKSTMQWDLVENWNPPRLIRITVVISTQLELILIFMIFYMSVVTWQGSHFPTNSKYIMTSYKRNYIAKGDSCLCFSLPLNFLEAISNQLGRLIWHPASCKSAMSRIATWQHPAKGD